MKKILLVISMAFLMLGCNNMMNTPTKQVEEFLSKYQTNDKEVMEDLDTTLLDEQELTTEQKATYKEVMKEQYKNLKYEIKEEKIDGNKATVVTEIEVNDFNTSLKESMDYLNEHRDEFYENDILNAPKFLDYKLDQLTKKKDKVKYTINFKLRKEKDKWTLEDLSRSDLEKIHGFYSN